MVPLYEYNYSKHILDVFGVPFKHRPGFLWPFGGYFPMFRYLAQTMLCPTDVTTVTDYWKMLKPEDHEWEHLGVRPTVEKALLQQLYREYFTVSWVCSETNFVSVFVPQQNVF